MKGAMSSVAAAGNSLQDQAEEASSFSYPNLHEINPDDLVFHEEIGRGTFATVSKGLCRGQPVAIKVLRKQVHTFLILLFLN